MNLEIRVGFPTGSKLVGDYVEGRARAGSFFEGSFRDPAAYRAKAREVADRFGPEERARAAAAIRSPDEKARERLERFVEEGGFFVTGGQQPGLFTGPLYTVYKALSAVRLADALERLLEAPVLPLFWVASEDHDWAEVNHAWVVDLDNELRRVELAHPPADDQRAIHRVPLDGSVRDTVSGFLGHLPETDFSGPYAELLRDAYTQGSTLSEAFAGVLEGLVGEMGLFQVDAAHPVLKDASRDVLEAELGAHEEHEVLLTRVASKLEEAGYHVQVPILEGGVNLFVQGPAGRERLYRDDDSFHLRHSQQRLSLEEVRARIRGEPDAVSPNVILRPVVESAVFPVVATLGGPGEMAYYAQLADLFRRHGIRMPVVHPRHGATLLEPKILKVMEKFDLPLSELERPHHELASELTRDEVPDHVRRALGRLRGAMGQGAGELLDAVKTIDPTLKGPVTHARNATFGELDRVEKKIVHALKEQNDIALQQLEKAQLHVFPEGKPQERVLNVFYYLFRFGDELLPALRERFDPPVAADSLEAAPPP